MEQTRARSGGAGLTKPARALSHRTLETLRAEASPYRIPDSRCQGLAVRVASSGKVTFDLSYRIKGGGARRLSLGSFPEVSLDDARNRAIDLGRAARQGRDLIDEEATARLEASRRLTVSGLIDRYCRRPDARNLKTSDDIERRLKRSLGTLADRFAETIRRRDLRELFDAVADQGLMREAEKRRQTIGAMFRWAVSADYLENDPTTGMQRYDGGQPRERVLTSSEIKAFWSFLKQGHIPAAHADVMRLQLLLGARCSEVGGMSAEEIDQQHWTWTLPAVRSKNKKARITPIIGLARDIVSRHLVLEGPLFVSAGGKPLNSSTVGSTLRNHRAQTLIPHFGTHDLRRTVASGLDELGVEERTIAAVIGHEYSAKETRTLRRHYIQTDYLKRKRAALDLWDLHLKQIVTEPT